jgi:RNA polymerase sigma-70 factor (ECF subfamily)
VSTSVTDDLRARFEGEALPHLRAVFNVARRLTQRDDDARDLAQDAYLRAFSRFETFAAGTNCRAWLFSITYSLFVNRYRRQQRGPELVAVDDAEAGSQPAAPGALTPSRLTPAHAAAEADVEAALAELPEEFRSAIMLVDVEDLSYEEAARVLACPVGTVRSRLSRARKQLADRLRDYDVAERRGR